MTGARYLTAVVIALAVNMALFVVLERMTVRPTPRIDIPPALMGVNLVALAKPPLPPPPPPERPLLDDPPSKPRMGASPEVPAAVPMALQPLNPSTDARAIPLDIRGTGGSGFGWMAEAGSGGAGVQGSIQPVLHIPPEYPERALLDGIEGTVVLEFDIGEDGTVRNPGVVWARPTGVFERVAVRAVLRWRYPERASAVRSRITLNFELGPE